MHNRRIILTYRVALRWKGAFSCGIMWLMLIEYGLAHHKSLMPTALTIGAFDGVHLGHQALIQTMVKAARSHDLSPIVLTFHPLPRQVLHGGTLNLLSTLEERLDLIAALTVEGAIVLPFDHHLMTSTAGDFIVQIVNHLQPGGLWVGPDFRFGKDREGDQLYLEKMGRQYGFDVHSFNETVCWDEKPVHSSRIRSALLTGNLDEVNGCLGRPYSLIGTIGHGEKRGRELGFPTANLIPPEERMLPANGVYIALAWLAKQMYYALVNVGTRPTFNHHLPTVEAYLLDFSGDLYGSVLRLEFLHLLRAELKFPNADALIAQMHIDEENARAYFQAR